MGDPAANQIDQHNERRFDVQAEKSDLAFWRRTASNEFSPTVDAAADITYGSRNLNVAVMIDPLYAQDWQLAMSGAAGREVPVRVDAQYADMNEMAETSAPEYAQIGVFGRAEPIRVYAGTSARDVSLTLIFIANSSRDVATVRERALWFDALKYPYMKAGAYAPPPPVYLSVGLHLTMRSIVTQCAISFGDGWTPLSNRPYRATVQLVFSSCSVSLNSPSHGPSRMS